MKHAGKFLLILSLLGILGYIHFRGWLADDELPKGVFHVALEIFR